MSWTAPQAFFPKEQIEITGAMAPAAFGGEAQGIHCDVDGTLTFKDGAGTQHTRTFKGGSQYAMTITEVMSKAGGFAGALLVTR